VAGWLFGLAGLSTDSPDGFYIRSGGFRIMFFRAAVGCDCRPDYLWPLRLPIKGGGRSLPMCDLPTLWPDCCYARLRRYACSDIALPNVYTPPITSLCVLRRVGIIARAAAVFCRVRSSQVQGGMPQADIERLFSAECGAERVRTWPSRMRGHFEWMFRPM